MLNYLTKIHAKLFNNRECIQYFQTNRPKDYKKTELFL